MCVRDQGFSNEVIANVLDSLFDKVLVGRREGQGVDLGNDSLWFERTFDRIGDQLSHFCNRLDFGCCVDRLVQSTSTVVSLFLSDLHLGVKKEEKKTDPGLNFSFMAFITNLQDQETRENHNQECTKMFERKEEQDL